MKKTKLFRILFSALMVTTLTACPSNDGTGTGDTVISDKQEFSFSASLESGRDHIEIGQTDYIVITPSGDDQEGRSYEFSFKKQIITLGEFSDNKIPVTATSRHSSY